jgi:hypothetical protein
MIQIKNDLSNPKKLVLKSFFDNYYTLCYIIKVL